VFDGDAFFSGTDSSGVPSLWETNGTASGTKELTGISGTSLEGLNPNSFMLFNSEVLFSGRDASSNYGLWVTTGTAAGTYELTGISGTYTGQYGLGPSTFTVFNGEVLFTGRDSSGFVGLWVTNGTAAGTSELTGISGAPASPNDLTVFNGEVLFSSGGLWVTNGTATGTSELTGISGADGGLGLNPQNLAVLNGQVLFAGSDSYNYGNSVGLWVTNGTSAPMN
jgi:ELWxxDGT repeat protein